MALRDNITAWWDCDEASGNRVDEVASLSLTDNNTCPQVTGKVGDGVGFNGTNEWLGALPLAHSLYTPDGDITFGGWFKIDTAPTSGQTDILYDVRRTTTSPTTGSSWSLRYFNDGGTLKVQCVFSGTSGQDVAVATYTLTIGTWFFIVGWHDASANSIKLYINNVEEASATRTRAFTTNYDTGVSVGSNYGGLYAAASADSLFVSNVAEDTSFISNLYNSGTGLDWAGTAGAAYTQDLNESVSITDSRQLEAGKNLTDTATITDTAQKDTSKAFSDSFTVTDAVATLVVSLVELAESITVTDTIQRAVGKVVAETATITDSIKRGLARTWSEAVTITDSVTALTATYTKELLESVSITDTVSRLSGYARSFTENLTITDRLYGLLNGVNMEYVDTYADTVGDYVDQYFNV